MTAAEIAARRSVLVQFQTSFNAFADVYNATLIEMEPFAVDDPETITALNEMATIMNAASPAVTTAIVFTDAIVPSDLPGVVITTETQQVACAPGYTGVITQERTVTTTDGVPAYGPWVEIGNTCVLALGGFVNSGFETPVLLGASYQYTPTGGGWIFTGSTGIQSNGSVWGAANAPEGQQTAFLQGNAGDGNISQTFSLLAGDYTVSFYAARRSGQVQPIQVAIDGVSVGTPITPASSVGDPFALCTTDEFTIATSGSHTLKFSGTVSGDLTSFIDAVGITAELVNSGFEIPVLAAASYELLPTGGSWAFSGDGSGIQRNGSVWGAAAAPEGQQTAFLQASSSRISQSLTLAAGDYVVSFQAARRAGQVQPIQVSIDDVPIGAPITPAGDSFAVYTTDEFTVVASGEHTVLLGGTVPGDLTSFIDAVDIAAPSIPASISVSPASVLAGGTVTVTWANIADPSATDWIALYEVGVTPGPALELAGFYVSGSWTPDIPHASGSASLIIPNPLAPATYVIYLFATDSTTVLASCSITITAAPVESPGLLTYVASYPTPTMTDTFVDPDYSRKILIGKHASITYCPLDQLIYLHGGDGKGWHWEGSSGNLGTVDTYNPVTQAYAESFLYRGVSGEVVPRGIDHMAWTWSPNLSKFWSGPGFCWDITDARYPWQDYTYVARQNYATYNTVTKKFTNVGARQGDIGAYEGQQAGWDSTRNKLIYFWQAHLRSVNPTTLEVESYWSPTGALPTSGHRTDENKGWYDADTDDYYFWEPTTGRVLALHLATNVFRQICNTGVVMARSATRATIFIPDGKFLLIVYSTFGPNLAGTALVTEGGAFPWKLINLTTGAMQSLNLFPPNIDRVDCGAYHPPSRTVVLAGGDSSGNPNNSNWFHHYYWAEGGVLPAWVPALNTVAAISGPGTAAPSTLSSVLYNTPVAGTGDGNGAAYFSAWCSGTYAPDYGALGALAFANGGDGDYWGNEGYIFDFNTRTWSRVGQRSTGLSGGTNGVDPNVDWNAWGEHTSPGGNPGPQPAIPHNNDAVEYLPPSLGGGNKGSLLFPTRSFCYALRKFRHPHKLNLETGVWSRASTTFDCLTSWNTNAATPSWCYDAARGKYWGSWGDFSGIFTTVLMNYTFANGIGTPGSNTIPNVLTPSRYPTSRHWPTGDLMLVIGIANGTETFIMQACPLATPSSGFTQLTLTGATIPFPHPGGSDAGGYGFAYCSDLDCFFVRTSADHRQKLWKITPPAAPYLTNSWVVTEITMAGVAVTSTGQFQGMWKRFNYVPALKSLVWVDSPSGAVYAYRVA